MKKSSSESKIMEHLNYCYLLLASFNEILKSTDVMDFIISLFPRSKLNLSAKAYFNSRELFVNAMVSQSVPGSFFFLNFIATF